MSVLNAAECLFDGIRRRILKMNRMADVVENHETQLSLIHI